MFINAILSRVEDLRVLSLVAIDASIEARAHLHETGLVLHVLFNDLFDLVGLNGVLPKIIIDELLLNTISSLGNLVDAKTKLLLDVLHFVIFIATFVLVILISIVADLLLVLLVNNRLQQLFFLFFSSFLLDLLLRDALSSGSYRDLEVCNVMLGKSLLVGHSHFQ